MPLHDKVVFELYKKPKNVQKAESYKPTQGMVTAAKRALRWKEEGKATGAGTPVGWGRATDIVAGRPMSLSVVTRMYSFFSRHEVDKKGKDFDNTSDPSNGRIMWDAWGGDAGFTWSKTIVERAKKLEKHLYGQHDQSTHAPHKRAGVPDGVDLDGKRFSAAARLELGTKIRDYESAEWNARARGYDKAVASLSTGSELDDRYNRDRVNDAYWTKTPTPEQQRIKDIIKTEVDADPEVARLKAELEDNYLFKDAMAVHDANGMLLGDKPRGEGPFSETPSAYLSRVIAGGADNGLPLEAYEKPTKFYSKEFNSDEFKDIRTTPEESVKIATDDFLEFASTGESVVFMPQDKLNQVLADGRVKTAHETRSSTAGQGTEEYIDHRLVYESVAYGYGDDTPIETRPVSGLLVGEGGYPSEAHSIYGGKRPAEIVLKPEVANRTTWTDGDSLNSFRAGTAFDSTIFRPTYLAAEAAVYRKGTGKNYFKTKTFASQRPIEIQVHGGIKVSDIGKVRFYTPPSKAVAARLERQGIPYETVPLPEGN